jgi:DNA helicase IV
LSNFDYDAELASEREYVMFLYETLDCEQVTAQSGLDEALRDTTATSPDAQWQRQVAVDSLTARVRGLQAADQGLCFGRIDRGEGPGTYIGRIGLLGEAPDDEPLLLDWRAPSARPFYTATIAHPDGVVRRRHFHTRGRTITGLHDDVLDLDATAGEQGTDAALLAALKAPREGQMRDIVATIQAEQDEIIRLGNNGIVVIEGGPGTGKTAVALHRVAYLLYTRRERLSRRGVLVIGPNPGFLDYISNILPSLGESTVVYATTGQLFPGLRTTAEDEPAAKRVKGALAMVGVLAMAIADRQELPEHLIPIELPDVEITIDK